MSFLRIKPLDAILATAEKKSLHRSLGPIQLTLLGIGAVIGTGIFVLTAAAAQKAGPGMMVSFIIAGLVCAVAARIDDRGLTGLGAPDDGAILLQRRDRRDHHANGGVG